MSSHYSKLNNNNWVWSWLDTWIVVLAVTILAYVVRHSYVRRKLKSTMTWFVRQIYGHSPQQRKELKAFQELKTLTSPAAFLVAPERALFGALRNKKRAVVGGINYYGTESQLDGCVEDAKSLAQRLYTVEGFRNIMFLVDDNSYKGLKLSPTGANIRKCMDWLTKDVRKGDSLWFSFSCHGTRLLRSRSKNMKLIKPKDGDGDDEDGCLPALCGLSFGPFGNNQNSSSISQEESGGSKSRSDIDEEYDDAKECMVPVDYDMDNTDTLIFDDEIYARLVAPLAHVKAQLTILLDCCHSGNGMGEQRYRYSYMSSHQCVKQKGLATGKRQVCTYEDPRFVHEQVDARVIYIGACRDSETAEDVDDDSHSHHQHYGAATKAYLSSVAPYNRAITYRQLFDGMYKWMEKNNISDQHPQFSSSVRLDLNQLFTL